MRKSSVILSVIAVTGVSASIWLWSELRAERARNAGLGVRLATIETAQAAPEPTTDTPARVSTTTSATVVATPAEASSQSGTVTLPSQEDWQAAQRRLLRDPRYREEWFEQQRLTLAPRRENLMRLLGFSAEQADATIDLSIERQMQWSADIPQEQFDAAERAHQAKLRDLLGAEKAGRLQAYMESRPSRMQVDQFRTHLVGADALRDDQVEPLIAALQVERSQMQQELDEYRASFAADDNSEASTQKYNERQAELLKTTHGRMHTAAAAILSHAQLEQLDDMLERDRERNEAQQRMTRIESKLAQPGAETAAKAD